MNEKNMSDEKFIETKTLMKDFISGLKMSGQDEFDILCTIFIEIAVCDYVTLYDFKKQLNACMFAFERGKKIIEDKKKESCLNKTARADRGNCPG